MTTYDIKPTSEAVRIPKWGKGAVLKVWAAALPMVLPDAPVGDDGDAVVEHV